MAISRIGIDFSVFNNPTAPDLDIGNTSKEILQDIPNKANEITGGWLGYGILGSLFVTCFWILADKSQFGDFGYDNLPALSLTFGICSIFGMVLLSGNFINSFIVVATSIFMMMITMGLIVFTETK